MSKRGNLIGVVALIGAFAMSACSTATRMPEITPEVAAAEAAKQQEVSVKDIVRYQMRLAAVAYRIETANTDLCGDNVAPRSGIVVLSSDQAPADFREAFAKLYGVTDQATVIATVPDSPGAASGVQTGDSIIAVNGESTPEGKRGVEQFETAIKDGKDAKVELAVKRGPETKTIWVTPVRSCSFPVSVQKSDEVNAWADGSSIVVTTGMLRFVNSDDELAPVVGHELAHDTMSHVGKERTNRAIGMVAGGIVGALLTGVTGVDMISPMARAGGDLAQRATSQDFEAEADYVGAYHAARAGYNVADAGDLWRRFASEHPDAIHLAGGSHPSTAKRFVAIEEAAKEIKTKEEAEQPLVPEMKDKVEPAAQTSPATVTESDVKPPPPASLTP